MTEYYSGETHWEHVRCWIPESMLHPDLSAAWPAISSLGGVPVCRPDLNEDHRDSYCFNKERHLTGRNDDRFDDLNDCLATLFAGLACYVPTSTSPATRADYIDIEVRVGEESECEAGEYKVNISFIHFTFILFNVCCFFSARLGRNGP